MSERAGCQRTSSDEHLMEKKDNVWYQWTRKQQEKKGFLSVQAESVRVESICIRKEVEGLES